MNVQTTRNATLVSQQPTTAEKPALCPVETAERPPGVPQPQVVVPGAASRWWDAHPAQSPQSTVLWEDEPASTSKGAANAADACMVVGCRGD